MHRQITLPALICGGMGKITCGQDTNAYKGTTAEEEVRAIPTNFHGEKAANWKIFMIVAGFLLTTPQFTWGGTALGDLAATMQPGTWAELTTSNINTALGDTASGGVGHILPYAEGIRWDPVTRKAYYIGSDDPGDGRRLVSYSEVTNSWSVLPDAWTGSGVAHEYDATDIDVVNRVLYSVMPDGNRGNQYNLDTGVFTNMPSFPSLPYSCCEASVYFPEMKGLILLNNGDLYKLSDATKQWSTVATGFNTTYHSFVEYNPIHKVVVFGGGNDSRRNFYKINSAGQVTTLRSPPIDLEVPRIEFTYDPATGIYLVFDYQRRFYTYNVLTDTWTPQSITDIPEPFWATSPDPNQFNTLATPLPTYGVIMFTTCTDNCTVYLYKHALKSDTTPPTSPKNLMVK